jgi:pimeloyl-ACP methyl ester carboxylesterase
MLQTKMWITYINASAFYLDLDICYNGSMVRESSLVAKTLTSIDGSKIYYETQYLTTSKATLVLLHGATGDASTWNRFRDILHAAGYSTLAIDLRGHGHSDRGHKNEFYDVKHIVNDILHIIKTEKLKKYILIGQCYGGTLLIKVASLNPEGLQALIALNTSYRSGMMSLYSKLPFKSHLISLIEKLPNLGKPGQTDFNKYVGTSNFHLGRIMVTSWRTTVKSVLFTFDKVFTLDVEKELKNLKIPVCIIGGTKDVFFPPKQIYDLGKKIKGSTVHILDEGDHIMCLNKPSEVASIIFNFFEKIKQ